MSGNATAYVSAHFKSTLNARFTLNMEFDVMANEIREKKMVNAVSNTKSIRNSTLFPTEIKSTFTAWDKMIVIVLTGCTVPEQ